MNHEFAKPTAKQVGDSFVPMIGAQPLAMPQGGLIRYHLKGEAEYHAKQWLRGYRDRAHLTDASEAA